MVLYYNAVNIVCLNNDGSGNASNMSSRLNRMMAMDSQFHFQQQTTNATSHTLANIEQSKTVKREK